MDSSKAALRRRLDFSVIYEDHMRDGRCGGCGALPLPSSTCAGCFAAVSLAPCLHTTSCTIFV